MSNFFSGYDAWKTGEPEGFADERASECDCCGELKYDCEDIYVSSVGDAHACAACRQGQDDEDGR